MNEFGLEKFTWGAHAQWKTKYTAPGKGMCPESQEWIGSIQIELIVAAQVQVSEPQEKLWAFNQDWILPNFARQKALS